MYYFNYYYIIRFFSLHACPHAGRLTTTCCIIPGIVLYEDWTPGLLWTPLLLVFTFYILRFKNRTHFYQRKIIEYLLMTAEFSTPYIAGTVQNSTLQTAATQHRNHTNLSRFTCYLPVNGSGILYAVHSRDCTKYLLCLYSCTKFLLCP